MSCSYLIRFETANIPYLYDIKKRLGISPEPLVEGRRLAALPTAIFQRTPSVVLSYSSPTGLITTFFSSPRFSM